MTGLPAPCSAMLYLGPKIRIWSDFGPMHYNSYIW